VAASVKLPHLEGDLVTFGVALGRLIRLVELADLVVDRRRGIGAGRHYSREHTLCVPLSVATSTGLEVDDCSLYVDRDSVSCEAMQEGPNSITVLERVPGQHIENDHRSECCSFVPVDVWMLCNEQSPQDEI